MFPLVSGTNSRLPSINHALISPILPHPVLRVALPPSVPLTHHFHHPSPLYSFTPGLKPSFSANPSHCSLPFLLPDRLHGFPRLFTDTSEHIRFYFVVFLFSTFWFLVPCCRSIWLGDKNTILDKVRFSISVLVIYSANCKSLHTKTQHLWQMVASNTHSINSY